MHFAIFTNNIRSYLLWSPVVAETPIRGHIPGSPPPSPPNKTVIALRVHGEKTPSLFSLLGSRPINVTSCTFIRERIFSVVF